MLLVVTLDRLFGHVQLGALWNPTAECVRIVLKARNGRNGGVKNGKLVDDAKVGAESSILGSTDVKLVLVSDMSYSRGEGQSGFATRADEQLHVGLEIKAYLR